MPLMDLLKRRGASPLRVKIESEIHSPTGTNIMPTVKVVHDGKETVIFSPISAEGLTTPFEKFLSKIRKSSNFSNSSDIKTPDVSPINRSNISNHHNTPITGKPANYTSRRYWASPYLEELEKKITSLANISLNFSGSDGDANKSQNLYEEINERENFSTRDCQSDEVFEVVIDQPSLESENYKRINNDDQFFNFLRSHSLGDCIPIFKEHEIDFDVFLTLTACDLQEIDLDMKLRDKVLNLIYKLHNSY